MRNFTQMFKSIQIDRDDYPVIGLIVATALCVLVVWYSLWQAFQ